jgi:hypothetical protein
MPQQSKKTASRGWQSLSTYKWFGTPCRFNLNSMPSFAEAELLPKFTALTGMHPDCPIPAYMRLDANLFFTNFFSFRGAWPLMAGLARLPGSSPSVAPTTAGGQLATMSTALESAGNASSQLVSPLVDFMKVFQGIPNASISNGY